MKITVLYNEVTQIENGNLQDLLADQDTVKTAKEISTALISLGYDVTLFCVDEVSVKKLTKNYPTDLFFNNAFGIGNIVKSESQLAKIIEMTGIPFTGATAKNIVLTTDKKATKNLLLKSNLPTPKIGGKKFPIFVKPIGEDCSLGITQTSVVQNNQELKNKIKELKKLYGGNVLVEEYIDGRELNVTVVGNNNSLKVLPISEIIFTQNFPGKYHIVDFDSKWKEDSKYYSQSQGMCPAILDDSVKKHIEEIAKKAFLVTKCRHFARVDMRLDRKNSPWILEVNANPGIGKGDGIIRSAKAAGFTYESFLDFLVQLAVK